MESLRSEANQVRKMGAVLLGVSTQDVKSHAAFAKQLKLRFPLLADTEGKMSRDYGVLMDPMRMAARVTFVIGPDARIRQVDEKVDFRTAGPKVLEMLRSDRAAAPSPGPAAATAAATTYPGWQTTAPFTTLPSGLQFSDITLGQGQKPAAGQTVKVHYTGYLLDGAKFDSSVDRGEPFSFTLGVGQVIKGWDEGLSTMAIGGKRKLIIPARLGYGKAGTPGGPIPPDATLVFDVQLLDTGH